jgi:hypothetical protein
VPISTVTLPPDLTAGVPLVDALSSELEPQADTTTASATGMQANANLFMSRRYEASLGGE